MKRLLIIILLGSVGLNLYSQEKYGFFDLDTLVRLHPNNQFINSELKKLEIYLQDSLNKMSKQLSDFVRFGMSIDAPKGYDFKWIEDSIRNMQNRIFYFQTRAQNRYNNTKEMKNTELRLYLEQQIQSFRVANNIKYIMDRKDVLYCIRCIDFTKDLLIYIQTKNNN